MNDYVLPTDFKMYMPILFIIVVWYSDGVDVAMFALSVTILIMSFMDDIIVVIPTIILITLMYILYIRNTTTDESFKFKVKNKWKAATMKKSWKRIARNAVRKIKGKRSPTKMRARRLKKEKHGPPVPRTYLNTAKSCEINPTSCADVTLSIPDFTNETIGEGFTLREGFREGGANRAKGKTNPAIGKTNPANTHAKIREIIDNGERLSEDLVNTTNTSAKTTNTSAKTTNTSPKNKLGKPEPMKNRNTKPGKMKETDQIASAYDNIEKILGSDVIKNMSKDSGDLAMKQQNLVKQMNDLTPILSKYTQMMDGFDSSKLTDILGGLNNMIATTRV